MRINTGRKLELGDTPELWQRLHRKHREVEVEWASIQRDHRLSARAMDEAQPAGPRAYIGVHRYLTGALEHQDALLDLLKSGGVTAHAPYALLRPSFECAFLAGWILDPGKGIDRRRRGLRCEVLDFRERKLFLEAYSGVPTVTKRVRETIAGLDRQSGQKYRQEADQIGLGWDRATSKINVVDELPRLSWVKGDLVLSATLVGQWRLFSGYEHGMAWATMFGSEQSTEREVLGGAEIQFTLDDDTFSGACKCVVLLLDRALSRLQLLQRSV